MVFLFQWKEKPLQDLTGRNVLITGGAGFIGYNLARRLSEIGVRVVVYDNLSGAGSTKRAEKLGASNIRCVVADVFDRNELLLAAKGVDVIFHLAALSSVPESYANPQKDCQINVLGTVNVLNTARVVEASVVFSSSSTVYGLPQETPTPEDHPLHPISFYGLSKLVAEKYCQAYHETYGLPTVVLRLFNVYGPEAVTGVIYDFLKKIQANNRRLEVIGSGEQSKDFIYVDDVVDAIIRATHIDRAIGEAYNLGSGSTTNVVKLAEEVLNLLGLLGVTEIACGVRDDWPGDVTYTHADIKKIKQQLGWKPQNPLEEGLLKTIKWFESKYEPIVRH